MLEAKKMIFNWIEDRGLKNIFKGRYKHLDYKPALRDKNGNKIPYAPREKITFRDLGEKFIQAKSGKINIIEFLENFLSEKNIKSRKFLPFLLAKKPKIKVTWYKTKRSEKGLKKIKRERPRPIMWASHFDALIYRYYCYIWGMHYEKIVKKLGLEKNVIAYRSIHDEIQKLGKNNISFAKDSFEYIQKHKNVTAVVLDISKFFENLDHSILKTNLGTVLEQDKLSDVNYLILKRLTKYSYIEQKRLRDKVDKKRKIICTANEMRELLEKGDIEIKVNVGGKGIPQGSPLSGLLANIYMINFDQKIRELAGDDVFYARYSDDIILIGENNQVFKIFELAKQEIKNLVKLEIKDEKTKITNFKNGICISSKYLRNNSGVVVNTTNPRLEYLGCEFDGKNIGIKSGSLSRYYQKLSKLIWRYRFAKHARRIIIRRSSYPTGGRKRNFGTYIKSALKRVSNIIYVKKQFSSHTNFINNGLKKPRKSK